MILEEITDRLDGETAFVPTHEQMEVKHLLSVVDMMLQNHGLEFDVKYVTNRVVSFKIVPVVEDAPDGMRKIWNPLVEDLF